MALNDETMIAPSAPTPFIAAIISSPVAEPTPFIAAIISSPVAEPNPCEGLAHGRPG
jgi:hypothetical protein